MTGLLRQLTESGYPADFLLSRVRGKRQQFATAGSDSLEDLQRDWLWIYKAMNPCFRERFAPIFLLAELRALQMMLRAVVANDRSRLAVLCRDSLLNDKLIKGVLLCREPLSLLTLCQQWFGRWLPAGMTLENLFGQGGHRRVEEEMANAVLRTLSARRYRKDVADYVSDQIDMRNQLTVARYRRWQLKDPPLLSGGGEVSRLLRAAKGAKARERLLQRYAGYSGRDVALLESVLDSRLSRRLEVAAREPLADGVVVDYLWRRQQILHQSRLNFWIGEEAGAWEAAQ